MPFETKKQLKEDAMLAEERATIHFRKLNQIELILKNADKTHEMYLVTVDKIKKVIFPNANLKR